MQAHHAAIAIAVFALTYAGLAVGKVPGLRMDRAAIAFVGATLTLVLGILTFAQAIAPDSIDYQTIFLLLGMMIVVAFLRLAGFFIRMTNWCLGRVRTPVGLLLAVVVLSGFLSAFLVNDVVCVALTPLLLHLCRRLRFDPLPHLIALATAANIGSAGTITGNPQNMIIGAQSHIPYGVFAVHLMPVAALGLVVDFGVILLVYRRRLSGKNLGLGIGDWGFVRSPLGDASAIAGASAGPTFATSSRTPNDKSQIPNPQSPILPDPVPNARAHRWLLAKSLTVTFLAVALFFAGLPIYLVALGAAGVLLVGRVRPARIYRQVDWGMLMMFVGLFIVVHGFQVRVVSHWGVEHWGWLLGHPVDLLSLVSAGLSNLVSNVPAVLLFEPVMHAIPAVHQQQAWLALAMSSTFAGNLTVLGSVANLIVVESAKREGVRVPFWEYCRVGIPVTILTLAIGVGWLMGAG